MSAATYFTAAVLAIALGVVGPALDATTDPVSDHSAEWPSSAELKALQATERGTQRREAAAQALCTKERGPQSEARWTPDGSLVCTQRRNAPQPTHTTHTITTAKAQL